MLPLPRRPRRAPRALWLLLALLPFVGHRGIAQVPPATTLAFAPTADTYVDSGFPTTNFNAEGRLRAKAPAARISYLRFVVSSVGSRRVQQARLRLEVVGAASSGGTIHRISDTTWNEATVTYNTRPALDGPGLATIGAVSLGQIVEFNLDTTVTGDGVYSLAIDSPTTDGVGYASMAATTGQLPSLVLSVTATTPTVTIVQPPDASSFFTGDPMTLQGEATDGAGGSLSSRITWTSSLAGSLGTGAVVTPTLTAGGHTITAAVTDDNGQSASSRIDLTVAPRPVENTPPLVAITSPTASQTLAIGVPVTLSGTADDLEDGPLGGSLTWSSDRDGLLGTGSALTHLLTRGVHDLTAAATDSGGQRGAANVVVEVHGAAVRSFEAIADASVDAALPDATFGSAPELLVDATHQTYLRFAVQGLAGRRIAGAFLRLRVDAGPGAGGDSGGTLHRVPADSWAEDTLTWRTRPAPDGPPLVSAGMVAEDAVVDLDLTPILTGDGEYDFVLDGDTSNRVTYRSREGGPAPALVVVLANDPPAVTIDAPAAGATVFAGHTVTLAGQALDAEDGDLSTHLAWTSSVDGPLGSGASIATSALHTGTHTLTAAATDSDGERGETARTIQVVSPPPPGVTITAPAPGASVFTGAAVTLSGHATDAIDGDLSAAIHWTSDRQGALGTGATLSTTTLATGTHLLTATVSNTSGRIASATQTLVVRVFNAPPAVTLVLPADGAAVLAGKPFLVSATAADPEDGDLGASVRWSTTPGGTLGNGATLVVPGLAAGSYIVTATVTDRDGASSASSATITVVPPLLTIGAIADTYVDSGSASTKFGTATSVLAGTSPTRQAYFRFTVRGTAGFTIDQARLRLTVGAGSSDGAKIGGTVQAFSNTTWSEATTTYSTRPALDGAVLATRSTAVAAKQVVDFDVTSGIRSDATYNLALTSTSSDWVRYGSREASTGQPVLLLTLGQNGAPLVRIGAPADGARLLPGRPVTFTGSALDAENGDLSAQLVWRSDRDGLLGTGASLAVGTLTPGHHLVTAEVTDAGGRTARATIGVDVTHLPTLTIGAPVSGSTVFASALPLTLQAQASDIEDGDLGNHITWASDRDGALGTGAVLAVAALSVGTHHLTAAVVDADGLATERTVTLTVRAPNTAPQLAVTAPTDGTAMPAGTTLALAAAVSDDFDTTLATQVRWTSSRDGFLGTGTPRSARLSEGVHTLTASVTDTDGATTSAQVGVTITPTAPVVTITAPPPAATVFAGDPTLLSGSAVDATDGDLSASLRWVSDRDGLLGTGTTVSITTLTVGPHVLTASVTDAGGLAASAQRTLMVRPPNMLPGLTLLAPTGGATLLQGRPVLLAARATDGEDGDLDAAIRWASNRDGSLGTGSLLTLSSLTVGSHTLSATVTDHDGATVTRSVAVTVVPAALAFLPTADTYVDSGKPTTKFGTATSVQAGTSPTRQTFLRFAVTGIGTLRVQQALLRLTVGANSTDGASTGGTLQKITNNAWSEAATTYATRPAIDGPVLATAGKVAAKAVVDFDVTSTITADATYNLALVSPSTDWVRYMSREASAGKPQVLISLAQNLPPVLTIRTPTPGTVVGYGLPLTLAASARDAENGDLGASVTWRSDRDGVLGTGASLVVTGLSPGLHAITAQVTDAGGQSAQADTTVRIDLPPTVLITSPAGGSTVTPGTPVTLSATATDTEDGNLSASLVWTSNLTGPLGTGATLVTSLPAGLHVLGARVTDGLGQTTAAYTTLLVNSPPVLTVTGPAAGSTTAPGAPVTLAATATDAEDGDLSAAVAWSSSLDGALGSGGTRVVTTLRSGTHVLTAAVTDTRGRRVTATRTVVVNAAPVLHVTAPADGTLVVRGATVTLAATANDVEDGALGAAIVWFSDRDGALGSGPTLTVQPAHTGTHHVLATVRDSGGLTTTASVTVLVDAAPTVTVTAPTGGAVFVPGQAMTLAATAGDDEDGDLSPMVTWTSNVDGALGTGGTLVVNSLRAGIHTLTAAVADTHGIPASSQVQVIVDVPPHITITAPGDGAVVTPAEALALSASATDAEDGDLGAAVVWTSDLDGPLGTGATVVVHLRSGTHHLSARVTDAHGEAATTGVVVIVNAPPAITIVAPTGHTIVSPGEPLSLAATASDAEDGGLDAGITWSSDLDGALGPGGALLVDTLRAGTHVLTANVVDAGGRSASAHTTVIVDSAPTVVITAPDAGTVVTPGLPLVLAALATDAEEGDLGSLLTWSSDLDGALGTGTPLAVSTLRSGAHLLTASVTDRDGRTTSARINLVVDAAPTVAITAPGDGIVIAPGEMLVFTATATDLEEGDLGAGIEWRSDLDGPLGSGRTLATTALRSGTHLVTATVTDQVGRTTSAQVVVRVNAFPVVAITTPLSGMQIVPGNALVLAAVASDLEDGDLSAAIAWSSDRDGALGTGATRTVSSLSVGTHVLTATVTDQGGRTATAWVSVVIDAAPALTIIAPVNGTLVQLGASVTLTADALDPEEGDLSAAIAWTSDLDGPLGSGATVVAATLRAGTHLVTATVADGLGLTTSATRTLIVNAPPAVAIVAPAPGSVAVAGQATTLSATATDAERGNLSAAVTWTSDLDGALGSGASLTLATLRPGVHMLTAMVDDGAGATASATVALLVDRAPTVAITAPAPGTIVTPGDAVTFTATASDPEDGALVVTWRSNLDGPLGTGTTLTTTALRSGTHVVTASVGDAAGVPASATCTLVIDAPPSVAITTPAPGAYFAFDEPIVLGATATDLEEGDLGAGITWSAAPGGALGGGASRTVGPFAPGTYTVTATVTDASGRSASASVSLVVAPLVTLSGTYTATYTNNSVLAKTRFLATMATFFAGPGNLYPISLEGGPGVLFRGGNVIGQYDRTWTWDQMHDLNNAALAFDNADFTVDGLRADNVEDGVRPRKGDNFTIRNIHLSYVRDDCVENDHVQAGLVDDSLLDGCYTAFSARPSAAIIDSGFNGANKLWTIQNTLVRLQPMPGPNGGLPTDLGNNSFFKWHNWDNQATSRSPKLALHNNIFMAEQVGEAGGSRMGIPPGKLDSCSNNIMVWLGPGSFPASLPSCFTITTDRTVWDNAVAAWIARHPQVAN